MAASSTTDFLPCEFCSELISPENLLLHQVSQRYEVWASIDLGAYIRLMRYDRMV